MIGILLAAAGGFAWACVGFMFALSQGFTSPGPFFLAVVTWPGWLIVEGFEKLRALRR